MSSRSDVTQSIDTVKVKKVETKPPVSSYFGINTFSNETMRDMVSEETFEAFKRWQECGEIISMQQADEIAHAMKDWAISKGATSYTHWFQPMTGLTAEKHDSFITMTESGKVMEKFTGSKLIQGEPDASSFPSGGIRATFEARGYTAWDPSSPAFITEVELGKTLCIPTIFISHNGDALDKKLPLLRSEDALCKSALKLLKLFNQKDVNNVYSTCGAEQEYFLIDRAYYKMRSDLMLTGRTLVGASSPKGQQLEDQYFGSIKERVLNYMADVAEEAYKVGIPVYTRHNEVAPHQFEFAPIFEKSNLAADNNQLLMDVMKKVAQRHNLACLLHEKPFAGVNGSGKHINWSIADDKGNNLLNPGETPEENLLFLTILVSIIYAVHKHSDILRASAASAGNEHRLGANEAPPAIVSIFLGEQLSKIINMLENGKIEKAKKQDIIDLGVGLLPQFMRDTTDRNRTSPFAFTGQKFEFRALGSNMNISTSITVINTIVADAMDMMIERIEAKKENYDFSTAVMKVLSEVVKESKAILYEGNNYSEEWVIEAQKRGLPNIPSSPQALKAYINTKTVELFERQKVLSKIELNARYTIWLDIYGKVIDIEAKTLMEIVKTQILPAAYSYQNEIASGLEIFRDLMDDTSIQVVNGALDDRKEMFESLTADIYYVRRNLKELDMLLKKAEIMGLEQRCDFLFSEVLPQMEHVRKHVDSLESVMPDDLWVLPKYRELLFNA
ncbi:glutamine synthetase III [Chitinispirillales bacterium ANBcel5]|uniref:glutamine synthetase III family protein n=1 Tax=Cellulosispirillum alkaliphilum TaxID=3039283 RepID=UPI002A56B034|nr:glutamine synthetase III [Chitinispirillales bacterium ANBcel5]